MWHFVIFLDNHFFYNWQRAFDAEELVTNIDLKLKEEVKNERKTNEKQLLPFDSPWNDQTQWTMYGKFLKK